MKCPCCNGTGGSMGNPDPADNWICACCNGTGEVPNDSDGSEDDDDDDDDE